MKAAAGSCGRSNRSIMCFGVLACFSPLIIHNGNINEIVSVNIFMYVRK